MGPGGSCAAPPAGPGSSSPLARTRCGTRSSPQLWMPGCCCAMCRRQPPMPTRAPRCVMTLPVSTSCGKLARVLLGQGRCCAVQGRVVGRAVDPAGPDDAYPGAGQDADGVGMVLASSAGVIVDLGGPGAGMPAVVGEGGHRSPEPLVAGPAEADGTMLARFPGHRGHPGERGDRV